MIFSFVSAHSATFISVRGRWLRLHILSWEKFSTGLYLNIFDKKKIRVGIPDIQFKRAMKNVSVDVFQNVYTDLKPKNETHEKMFPLSGQGAALEDDTE